MNLDINCSEIVVTLFRLSLYLGNNCIITDEDFDQLIKSLGLSMNKNYYNKLKNVMVQQMDISFSISKYENYLADKVRLCFEC